MPHIGNDIIALNCTENIRSFRSEKFLGKIFCKTELNQIYSSGDTLLPYKLWTCKESAYKIAIKKGCRTAFSPALFKVEKSKGADTDVSRFTVIYKNIISFSKVFSLSEIIYCVASDNINTVDSIHAGIYQTAGHSSEAMYQTMINEYSRHFSVQPTGFSIKKDATAGIPVLFNLKTGNSYEVSFSHDLNYYMYSFLKKTS